MADPIKVLLVDDEVAITSSLAPFLERSGFEVRVAVDGVAALAAAASWRPTIIVCDVLMPRLDGREVVRELRQQGDWTPLILLTKVDATSERSAALDEGADDYLSKPFDPDELVSRIRAVLRRAVPGTPPLSAADRLVAGDLLYDRRSRRVWLAGRELALTPRAMLLLEYLMGRPGEVHSRDRLLSTLWGYDFPASTRAVDHRVAELRRVLGDDAGQPRFIETVQTLGYRFVSKVARG
ncbi:response regulator transcription factor [Propionicimonas sp.]|uniref:response regulator transcription factor n=1 Tax=Propionicimonas sp. TaxID=1955623 RepID=UPI00179FAAA2|nr:response regulator transcription factor [Propionicimonas sp.]MBU3976870.1 response regulator transcription factor [Actinomycetota bacterium]MBA3019559.1 response regulator transcription factor [Propionicimonas sp.]MBU3986965.1 response regulator transcription factor [Actinomycetota bacterium]MBU4006877.1 response regulator transcription factor [Actinomycetota bacterium]MBU4065577.1 response regulator transcription factor [Actinomycetota bacterium]